MAKKLLSFLLAALMLAGVMAVVPAGAVDTVEPYKDVPTGKWYSAAIRTMYEKGIMTGKKPDVFDPTGNVTRAEFVTILYRLSGEEFKGGTAAFTDVKAGSWYEKNVLWAAEKELVKGYPDNTFKPNDSIKRSEMVTLLARYIEYKGIRVIPDSDAAQTFPDAKAGSFYAKSLETVRKSGLIKGDTAGNFRPDATATRAEAAVLFSRFLDMVALGEELEELKEPLPVIRLDTETGRDVESKEEYILTDFSLTAEDGRDISVPETKIRGRGNSTWIHEKKSYKLKFPEKICLMRADEGNTEAKEWTLLACHSDKSLIRNYVAYRMARRLDGIEWSPYAEMAEVYLNGEYRGVYMLSEQVEVKADRVNIKDGAKKDDIGFFIELDSWAKGEYNEDWFTMGGIKYSVKSDFRDKDQVIAMKCHLETVYNVILEGDREKIEEYVDIPSAVDTYLLNEVYMNVDVDWSSFFMYFKEPQGKLFFGPVWDQNLAFGNSFQLTSETGLFCGHKINASGKYTGESNVWLAALMTNGWFREAAAERWNEVRDILSGSAKDDLKKVSANIEQYEKNFELWQILRTAVEQEPPKLLRLGSCLEHVQYVDGWISRRIKWLDGFINSDRFTTDYPADRTKIDLSWIGQTDVIEDRTRWIIPDWFGGDKVVQIYLDSIYDHCETKDGRIMIRIGGRATMTPENMNKIILEEYMGLSLDKYTLIFDETEFEAAKDQFGGLGDGQSIIFELKTGFLDLETGERSTMAKVIYTFTKDLSLNEKFGV